MATYTEPSREPSLYVVVWHARPGPGHAFYIGEGDENGPAVSPNLGSAFVFEDRRACVEVAKRLRAASDPERGSWEGWRQDYWAATTPKRRKGKPIAKLGAV